MVDQSGTEKRFGAIVYNSNASEFVFTARRASDTTSSRICQLQQGAYEIPAHLLYLFTYYRTLYQLRLLKTYYNYPGPTAIN